MANYTVNAYNNGGSGGSVNMRSGPSTGDGIVVQVPHGATVTGTKSGTWSYMSYSYYSGYMMSVYLDDQGGSSPSGTLLGTGTVIGGGPLYCRKEPVAGYDYWGQFKEGATIEIYSCSTSGWYETRWNGNMGYVMTQFISMSGGGSAGGALLGTGQVVGGGPLYCRQQPVAGYTAWGQFAEGATIQIYSCTTPGWYETRWNGNKGYVMSEYIDMDSSTPGSTFIGNGTVIGGALNCRKEPSSAAAAWGQFSSGASVPIHTCTTTGWYETRWNGNTGYVMSQYISMTGGGTSGSVTFDPNAAVAYAKAHSQTTDTRPCPNRNTSFGNATTNGCANFVSQCLVAGGLPMFDGWCYHVPGISSSWKTGGWTYTWSGYRALNDKGRVSAIALTDVQPGDIIYLYNSANEVGKQYTHVVLAVSKYANGSVSICGHTANENTVPKTYSAAKVKCYRVNRAITIGSNEKRVTMPATGSGATAY